MVIMKGVIKLLIAPPVFMLNNYSSHRPLIKIAFEAELLPKKYFDNSSQSIIDTSLTKKFNILPLIFAQSAIRCVLRRRVF